MHPSVPHTAQPSPRAQDLGTTLVAIAIFIALSLREMSAYLPYGRFWAEEGRDNLPATHGLSWSDTLRFIFHGHLELYNNALIMLAQRVPFRYAPLVTTAGSFAVQLAAIALLCRLRSHLGLNRAWLVLVVVLAVALPQASEVFANSANVHFHFTLIALLLLLAPVGVSAWQRGATIAGLLLCGVSSIAANFLAPLALWQAIQARQRARWIQCGALFATALAQALLLLSHPDGMHSRGTDGIGLDSLAAMVAQLGLAPLSMLLPTDSALRHLQGAHSGDLRGLAMLLGSIALAIGVLYRAWRQHDRITQQLLVAGLLVAALSTLVALTPSQHDLISTSFAGRYYYVPCVIMVIVVGRLLSSRGNWLASGLPVLLILLCAVQIRPDQRGLPWQMALARAEQLDADQVDIWPTGWHTPNLSNSKIVAGVRLIPVESAALREYGQQRLPYLQTQATHRLDKNVLRITFTPDPLGHKLSLVYAVIPTRPRASRLMASDDGAKWIAVLHYDTAEAAQQAANAFCFAGETQDGYRALLAPIGTACREYVQQR